MLVLIAATNQPAVQAVDEAVGLPLFLARQLRLHCRQLLRRSASHPTCGMLSTKNWAVSLGYATLSTSPRRTGTRSHPPTRCGCVEPQLGTLRRYHAVGLMVCASAQGWDVLTKPLLAGYPELGTFVALRGGLAKVHIVYVLRVLSVPFSVCSWLIESSQTLV